MVTKTKVQEKRVKLTRKEAIKLFCYECMGYQKQLVNKCPDIECVLWTFRNGPEEESDVPFRKNTKKKGGVAQ